MIPVIDVRHDLNRLVADLGLLRADIAPAAARSLNRAMSTARAEAARQLGVELDGLKIGTIKKRIVLGRATQGRLTAALTFSNKRLRFANWNVGRVQTPYGTGIRLGGRLPKKLLRVDAISGKVTEISTSQLGSAFLQRSRRFGIPNIWLRQGKASMPIDVLVTPSLSELLVQGRLDQIIGSLASDRFPVVFAQEAAYRLSKRSS